MITNPKNNTGNSASIAGLRKRLEDRGREVGLFVRLQTIADAQLLGDGAGSSDPLFRFEFSEKKR